jgi:hypothetical protein
MSRSGELTRVIGYLTYPLTGQAELVGYLLESRAAESHLHDGGISFSVVGPRSPFSVFACKPEMEPGGACLAQPDSGSSCTWVRVASAWRPGD